MHIEANIIYNTASDRPPPRSHPHLQLSGGNGSAEETAILHGDS